MRTQLLSSYAANQVAAVVKALQEGRTPDDIHAYHKVEHTPKMLFLDPINGDPWVYILPDMLFVFDSIPPSGTDHLRQRMLAQRFFDRSKEAACWHIVEKKNALALHGVFDSKARAEEFLRDTIPLYCARGYYMDKTLTAASFMVVEGEK